MKIIKVFDDKYSIIDVNNVVDAIYEEFGSLHWFTRIKQSPFCIVHCDNSCSGKQINKYVQDVFGQVVYGSCFIVNRDEIVSELSDKDIKILEGYLDENNKKCS